MVSLDGSTRIVGTEFIKLEITGSSNLATEAFVLANGGGGGGGDLTNYYDKTEVDNLIVDKLNKDNPQDMSGTLRIGKVLGTSKIILNATDSDKDFYVNGEGQINGTMTVLSLDSSGHIQGGSVLTTEIDTGSNANLDIQRNNVSMIELQDGKTIFKTATECRDIFHCDHFENEPLSPIIQHIMNEPTGQIKYYVGSPTVPDTTTNLVMVLKTDKIEINKPAVLSDELKTNTINSNGISDVVFKRNDVSLASLTATDFRTETGIDIISNGEVKCNKFESIGDANVEFYRNGNKFFSLQQSPSGFAYPAIVQPTDYCFITDKIFCDELRNRYNNKIFLFWGGNSSNNGRVNYLTYRPASEDVMFYRSINIDTGYSLSGDLILGNDIRGDTVYGDSFRCKNFNVDTPFLGANLTEDGRITFMTYRHLLEDVRFLRNILIDDTYRISSNIYDSSTNADVYLKRNNIDYIQLGGTALRTRLLTGCQSDIYDSLGNSDVSYRRNGIDFMYLRNGNLELNTNIGLKTDTIDTIGNTNLVVKQNGATILYYDVGDATYPNGIFKFDKDVSINTTKYIQCNTIKAHIFDTHDSLEPNDVSFRYNGTTYMFYDQSLSNFQVRTDIASNQNITCVALTETSDKRLKENIDDFHSNCSEIVKKINVKKYKFKDDKSKKTNIGFIADDVLENTPNEIENIVDTKNDYLSMNYGRMCCLLWKATQELLDRVDTLESEVAELKKTKPKAKAKE